MLEQAGLILEGGAVRGVFTSGVLDYLMEQDIEFSYIVGVSAGACNGVDMVSKQIGRTMDCMVPKDKNYNYHNHKNMLKRKSFFDMDMIFDTYPNQIYPFDYDTFFQSKTKCEFALTNCITGKAEYLEEKEDRKRLMQICRASSSLPLVSPIVYIDDIPYLDGGIADSIPIRRSMSLGNKKNIVILTRNANYRKKISKKRIQIFVAAYRQYPELIKTIYKRAERYNKTLDFIERLEKENKIFVLRPEIPAVSKLEKNEKVLKEFYQHGYELMKEKLEEMKKYLETNES